MKIFSQFSHNAIIDDKFENYKNTVLSIYDYMMESGHVKGVLKVMYKNKLKPLNKSIKKFKQCQNREEIKELTMELYNNDEILSLALWVNLIDDDYDLFEDKFIAKATKVPKNEHIHHYLYLILLSYLLYNENRDSIATAIIDGYNNNTISCIFMDVLTGFNNQPYNSYNIMELEKYIISTKDNTAKIFFACDDFRGVRTKVFDAIDFYDDYYNAGKIMNIIYNNEIKNPDILNEFKRRIINAGLVNDYIKIANSPNSDAKTTYTVKDFYKGLPEEYQIGVII